MRLDKFLSHSTDLSRKEVKQYIKKGKVCVGERVVTRPEQDVDQQTRVKLEGKLINYPSLRYLALNKPVGYVSATKDTRHQTAIDLIDLPNKLTLHIAGRLDIDTTGLLLITDDGQWAHRIMSPNHECAKTYHVQTRLPISSLTKSKFQRGIYLEKENYRTKPAVLKVIEPHSAHLIIREGKFHQIKRMFHAVGNEVVALHRIAVGSIELGELALGQYRTLEPHEIKAIV